MSNKSEIKSNIKAVEEQLMVLKGQLEEMLETDEIPVPKTVKISDRAYEMGVYPVTFDEYDAFCKDTNRKLPGDAGWGRGNRPVINVSWYDAKEYCKWLSEKTGEEYDLPTEDEFQHCCGDHQQANEDIAHYCASSTIPVGSKAPNKYGLYDMLGNVLEWTDSLWG